MWANEQEAACLSGYSVEAFRAAVESLEMIGFPKKNSRNGQRFIPHILRFWERDVDSGIKAVPESPALNIRDFEDDDESFRRPARY